MRCLVERLSENEILAIDACGDVPNCATHRLRAGRTRGAARGQNCQLRELHFTLPQEAAGEALTDAPDVAAAAKP